MRIKYSIIGSGIIGLFTAWEIAKRGTTDEIVVFEKNPFCGDETTGRNSGVLHSGIYYPTNSLKHLSCIEGNKIWRELSSTTDVDVRKTGKFVVSSTEKEQKDLENLFLQAQKNNVQQIRKATSEEKKLLNKYVHIHDALFSGTTGIIDVPGAVKFLKDELFKLGIPILLEDPVVNISQNQSSFNLRSDRENIETQYLINCAGLGAIDLRKQLGLTDFENYFVKGNYLQVSPDPKYPWPIYPIPQKDLKGLGTHSTMDISYKTRFGPNTEDISHLDYKMRNEVIDSMFPSINKVFKNISKESLAIDYCGIRPKIKRNGDLYKDFWLGTPHEHGIYRYFEFLGIESPGLTAAPALAKRMVDAIIPKTS